MEFTDDKSSLHYVSVELEKKKKKKTTSLNILRKKKKPYNDHSAFPTWGQNKQTYKQKHRQWFDRNNIYLYLYSYHIHI